ncbi:MAG: hypothetical protein LC647_09630 [Beggiatoa sp.]|nr:hypothetical protein [Beggiatoa sp.]
MFEALCSILGDGKAIAFVGAGASAPMYPLWGQFIELLADHAVAEGKAEENDAKRWKADTISNPQQRVNVILRKLGEPRYRNFLRHTFGPRNGPDGRRYTATHAALLRLPFRGYAATNYDPRAGLRPSRVAAAKPQHRHADLGGRRRGLIAGAPGRSSPMTARCSGSTAIGSARPASY